MSELENRNAKAIAENFRVVNTKVTDLQKEIESLKGSLSALSDRLNSLEQMLRILQSQKIGRGPTT